LSTIKALVRRAYPRLLTEPLAWLPAYTAATNRTDDGDQMTQLGRGELRSFLIYLVYFSKGIMILADKEQHADLNVSFSDFTSFLQLMKLTRSLAQAASAFDFLDQTRFSAVSYHEVCAWIARDLSPHGVRASHVNCHTTANPKVWARLQLKITQACEDHQVQQSLWEGANYNLLEMIRLGDVVRKMGEVFPLLQSAGCWHAAYEALYLINQDANISGGDPATSDGNQQMWIERGEFQVMLIAGFVACKLQSLMGPEYLKPG
jgi:hypothetical protein